MQASVSNDAYSMKTTTANVLVLGGTGRTGTLLARKLREHGGVVRTASRHGSDVIFDWDDPATYRPALHGVESVYLVPPVMRVRYASEVATFLDEAGSEGIRHVTLLSTYNGHLAPDDVDIAAVETEVAGRQDFSHTILQPAWVMQNFLDNHLPIVDGVLVVPSEGGAESFVDAADIAAVVAASLTDPSKHADHRYALTGPEALTLRRRR